MLNCQCLDAENVRIDYRFVVLHTAGHFPLNVQALFTLTNRNYRLCLEETEKPRVRKMVRKTSQP